MRFVNDKAGGDHTQRAKTNHHVPNPEQATLFGNETTMIFSKMCQKPFANHRFTRATSSLHHAHRQDDTVILFIARGAFDFIKKIDGQGSTGIRSNVEIRKNVIVGFDAQHDFRQFIT